MGFLPSKNFIAPVFTLLVVILVGWFVVYIIPVYTAKAPLTSNIKPPTSFLLAYEDANRDSDNDGLKDWEEILWKTDLLKADTDGDGTSDSEEIKIGRDPTSAGPNDKLKAPVEAKPGALSPQTLTDRISQRFAAEYLSTLGGAGGNLNDFQKKSIAESLLESVAGATLATGDQFSSSDIKMEASPSSAFTKKYLENVSGFLNKTFAGLGENELDILNRALDTASPAGGSEKFDELKKLDAYVTAYKKSVEFLKKERAPASYAALHLELMNILNNTSQAVLFIKVTDKDPARGLAGLSMYLNQAERLQKFYKSGGDKLFKNPGS